MKSDIPDGKIKDIATDYTELGEPRIGRPVPAARETTSGVTWILLTMLLTMLSLHVVTAINARVVTAGNAQLDADRDKFYVRALTAEREKYKEALRECNALHDKRAEDVYFRTNDDSEYVPYLDAYETPL
jgi:hypothetical protein